MITVYLENVWEEIITERGRSLFLEKGVNLEGNLFNKKANNTKGVSSAQLIIATDPQLSILQRAKINNIPVIFYALFPDQITGWDYKHNTYKNGVVYNFSKKINQVEKVLVNSNYSKNLLKSHLNSPIEFKVCYLGIDYKSISQKSVNKTEKQKSIKVLWNHMWRKDKGFIYALSIILYLARKFPKVDFYIGRKEEYAGGEIKQLKEFYRHFLYLIEKENIKNIYFVEYFYRQRDYWDFLKTMDISFTCSPHETFGISMLEQQAAGIACVVPKIEVYPEIHKGSLQVTQNGIEKGIEKLILDKELRTKIGKACVSNSSKFKIETFVSNFFKHIQDTLE